MKIYDCKVNHLKNPMGFRMTRTVFSWKVKDAQGKKQAEARIQAARDCGMKEKNNPIFGNVQEGACVLEAGDYSVSYKLTRSLKKKYNLDSTW